MSNYLTDKEMANYLNLPISDKFYPDSGCIVNTRVILDEATNVSLLRYLLNEGILFYITKDSNDRQEFLCVCIEIGIYFDLPQKFPDIREVCIAPKISYEVIDDNIKEYYETIPEKEAYPCIKASTTIDENMIELFDYYLCTKRSGGFLPSYYIHVPDYMTYKKASLLLGGHQIIYHFRKVDQ